MRAEYIVKNRGSSHNEGCIADEDRCQAPEAVLLRAAASRHRSAVLPGVFPCARRLLAPPTPPALCALILGRGPLFARCVCAWGFSGFRHLEVPHIVEWFAGELYGSVVCAPRCDHMPSAGCCAPPATFKILTFLASSGSTARYRRSLWGYSPVLSSNSGHHSRGCIPRVTLHVSPK